jgi:hypothetical protein
MNPPRVAAYVLFGLVLVLGVIIALIAWLAVGRGSMEGIVSAFGTLLIFVSAAAAGFAFLGTTQETATRYPLSKKRAAWYTLAAALISFGLLLLPVTYFGMAELPGGNGAVPGGFFEDPALLSALGVLIPFFVPGLGLFVFLYLTEKNHLKPWAIDRYAKHFNKSMEPWNDPEAAARFGLISGAIWIFAFGLFFLLGFVISFKFSWLTFIFAVAIQLLVQALMYKPKNETEGEKE